VKDGKYHDISHDHKAKLPLSMTRKHMGVVEVELHSFLKSAPDVSNQLHTPATLTPGKVG